MNYIVLLDSFEKNFINKFYLVLYICMILFTLILALQPNTSGVCFFTNTNHIILKHHSYNKALDKEAYYIEVPKGHKSKFTTGEQLVDRRL
jgi:uncharacterized membrane protein YcgQ (UPF0703/DUF1980 family)